MKIWFPCQNEDCGVTFQADSDVEELDCPKCGDAVLFEGDYRHDLKVPEED